MEDENEGFSGGWQRVKSEHRCGRRRYSVDGQTCVLQKGEGGGGRRARGLGHGITVTSRRRLLPVPVEEEASPLQSIHSLP